MLIDEHLCKNSGCINFLVELTDKHNFERFALRTGPLIKMYKKLFLIVDTVD